MERYDHQKIEKDAQEKWASLDLYQTNLSDEEKDPYYLLVEFPYPSGDLHIGHWYAFAVTDIYARALRARGKNVLFPIGFDAFGLPAENAAIKHGLDPKDWTYKNMERMREQLRSMGSSFDWSKEVVTCDPGYYQWTQWLFTKLFEHGLAERKNASVKWCPKDQTVLANEQVVDGCCERCGTEVEERALTQWFLKITDYAERLLADLEPLPWREEIKDAQRAWIGKSEGATLRFNIADTDTSIEVFTTRPDTIFGATYVVLAPEHPLVTELLPRVTNKEAVQAYIAETKKKTERERSENKEKTGEVLAGVAAINPASKETIPVYIADYVLASYGTGAVMAVPAHDERDFEFAKKMNLPMREVVMPRLIDHTNPHQPGKELVEREALIAVVRDPKTQKYLCLKWKHQPWTTFVTGGIEKGESAEASARREVEEETGYKNLTLLANLGRTSSEFYASHKGVNRIANNTVLLFELADETRTDVASDETAKHEPVWLTAQEIEKAGMQHAEFDLVWRRVQHGLDAFTQAGVLINSGEFTGRKSDEAMWDIVAFAGGEKKTQYRLRDWLVSRQRYWGCPIPVVYDPEGTPHAIPSEHLPWTLPTDVDFTPNGSEAPLASSKELKERVTKIFGEGWTPEYDTLDTFVDSSWYFSRYLDPKNEHQFSDAPTMKKWLPVNRYSGGSEHTTMHLLYARFFTKALYDLSLVPVAEPFTERFNRGLIMGPDGQKMSKSKGNVVNPDEVVSELGSDAVRTYLAFIGPYNEPGSYPWKPEGVAAMRKFLERVHRLGESVADDTPSEELLRALTTTVQKVADDADRFKFNTAVAALMTLLNTLEKEASLSKIVYRDFLIMLAPFAPHLSEYLWEQLGEEGSVHEAPWPKIDEQLLSAATVSIAVQINGKLRGTISVSPEASQEEVLEQAQALPSVAATLSGAAPKRVVYVPSKILNLVV